jgi:hypothetical protein
MLSVVVVEAHFGRSRSGTGPLAEVNILTSCAAFRAK